MPVAEGLIVGKLSLLVSHLPYLHSPSGIGYYGMS